MRATLQTLLAIAALSCLGCAGCSEAGTAASSDLASGTATTPAAPRPQRVAIRPALTLGDGAVLEPDSTLRPAAPPPAPPGPGEVPAKALAYVERGHRQLDRLEGGIGDLGPLRDAAAALASAALAAHGRGEAGEAARHAAKALGACAGQWHTMQCERGALPLQRLVLQFPAVLPEELGGRLRGELATPVPPPAEPAGPWAFQQTENQRLVTLARAIGAHVAGGTAGSPGSLAWNAHAEALLAARDEAGFYEEESAGYLGLSVQSLVHLHDFAPAPRVRQLAGRQLHLLFARWAERQVAGVPAGARTRTYIQWALGERNLPWPAWAWHFAGVGDVESLFFGDWPEMPLSAYALPAPLVRLLAERPSFGTYEVRQRRSIAPQRRRHVDAAIYTWATPDYLLSSSMAVDGMALAVSGGEEVPVVLLPEGDRFAPLYLWSRFGPPRGERWRNRSGQEQPVGHRDVALAALGTAGEPGHAYLAPGWQEIEVVGDTVVARHGDTWVALTTGGGWEVALAQQRFAAFYGTDRNQREARVAVPRRQPAAVALEVGRAAEDGSFAAWKRRAASLALEVERSESGEPVRLAYRATDGRRLEYRPGRSVTVDGEALDPRAWPRHASPFLAGEGAAWRFVLDDFEHRFAPLAENRRPEPEPRPEPAADGRER